MQSLIKNNFATIARMMMSEIPGAARKVLAEGAIPAMFSDNMTPATWAEAGDKYLARVGEDVSNPMFAAGMVSGDLAPRSQLYKLEAKALYPKKVGRLNKKETLTLKKLYEKLKWPLEHRIKL